MSPPPSTIPAMLTVPYAFTGLRASTAPTPTPPATARASAPRGRKRPRGLWRARNPEVAYVYSATHPGSARFGPGHRQNPRDDDDGDSDLAFDDDDLDDCRSSASGSSKRQRRAPADDDLRLLDVPLPAPVFSAPSLPLMNDATNAFSPQGAKLHKVTCDYGDWEDLKKLFARAAEEYERDDAPRAISLLRALIDESARFLKFYIDPSVLFATPPTAPLSDSSPESSTPSEERLNRDWGSDKRRRKSDSPSSPTSARSEQPSHTELSTAFHAILGIALFLYGNLIAQDSTLAFEGELDTPTAYWLCALDVFETAENLPSRTSGSTGDAEDWRMAIVWGRTLVCLADEKLNLAARGETAPGHSLPLSPFAVRLPTEEPNWPAASPFRTIAARRAPVTGRITLAGATAHDIMVQAMDQFSRGIFHMPHPQPVPHPHAQSPGPAVVLPDALGFSRPKELFTIATEVLGVAERLEQPDERRYWASWADSVFNQMKMEADMDEWRARVTTARGRCWLIAGSARVDELEEALESGRSDVLQSAEAEEAREGLGMAITFFDRAKGSASTEERDLQDLQLLLAEALLSLANLTVDENTREELYSRAQAEGGESVVAALSGGGGSSSDLPMRAPVPDDDVGMDTS